MPGHPINSLIDRLLKVECDHYGVKQTPHPIALAHGIDAFPFAHPMLDEWRENFKGMQHHHAPTNLVITGAIDDLWMGDALHVVDYKATATKDAVTLDGPWKEAYKRQMEIYQWLTRRQDLPPISSTGFFFYCNGQAGPEAWRGTVQFTEAILPYVGDDSWVEPTIVTLKECLTSEEIPAAGETCEHCGYIAAIIQSAA